MQTVFGLLKANADPLNTEPPSLLILMNRVTCNTYTSLVAPQIFQSVRILASRISALEESIQGSGPS